LKVAVEASMTHSAQSAPRVGPGVAAGVTEPMIRDVVHAFYGKIRRDPALGPIFNRVVGDDWDHHLAKMCDFWSSVLLMTGRFKGAPMAAHAQIPEIRPTHFARWLHVFHQTVAAVCPPAAAGLFVAKSDMIAQALQLHIAATRGELPPARSSTATSVAAPRDAGKP
jgi:hemoglobin